MASNSRFVDGEKVLCFHGPLMYEARCLKSEFTGKEMKYFIHYSGWNKKWDEWVTEFRVFKYNETNLQRKKEVEKDIVKTKKSKSAYKPVVKKEKEIEKEPVPSTSSEKPVKACKTKEKVPKKKVPKKIVPESEKSKSAYKPVVEKVPVPTTSSEKPLKACKTKEKVPKVPKKKVPEKIVAESEKSKSAYKPVVEKVPVPTTSSEKPLKACKTKEKVPKVPKKKVPEKIVAVSSSCPEQNAENQPVPKKKKVRFEPVLFDETAAEVKLKLEFPDPLKDWLIDDDYLINRQKMILSLPARITVDHVVANFVKEKVSDKGISQSKENTIVQVTNKIRECFNVLLGKSLLYKFERAQYAEILVEYRGYDMSQLYGAIHLLRMFTKLGELLTPIVGTENPSSLLEHLNDFLKYMSMNRSFFSVDDYGVATREYLRRAL